MKHGFKPPAEDKDFAKLLSSKVKLSGGYASDLARGKRRPSLAKAVAFEKAYGIPCHFWIVRRFNAGAAA